MKLPSKKLENKLFAAGYDRIIAVDEVGMGCLAGPVVVCAVALDKGFFRTVGHKLSGLRDSKLLSAKQREVYAARLAHAPGLHYRLARCLPKTIDHINIYQAARTAMRRAVRVILRADSQDDPDRTMVLVDGPHKIRGLGLPQIAVTKGDRRVFAIACASIIAKVARDKMMTNFAKRYPNYGFERHKGYSTHLHQVQLAALGPTPIHRRSFSRLSFWTKENPRPWETGPKI